MTWCFCKAINTDKMQVIRAFPPPYFNPRESRLSSEFASVCCSPYSPIWVLFFSSKSSKFSVSHSEHNGRECYNRCFPLLVIFLNGPRMGSARMSHIDIEGVEQWRKKCWRKGCAQLQGRQSWGVWRSRPPDFGQGGRGGPRGRGRVVKYYFILSCTGSMFERGDYWREIE